MPSDLKPRFASSSHNNNNSRRGTTSSLLQNAEHYDKSTKASMSKRKERRQFCLLIGLILVLTMILLHLSTTRKINFHTLMDKYYHGNVATKTNNSLLRTAKKEGDDAMGSSSSSSDGGPDHNDSKSKLIADKKLVRKVQSLDAKVREYKAKPNVIMETDPEGLKLTKELQQWTYKLLTHRYGPYKFRVVLDLTFPKSIPDYAEKGPTGQVTIQMASPSLIPCSVFNFLEIARTWKGGAFHRNANHVLQASARSQVTKSMPFQEYSPEHPHKKGSAGYAGRPSGPGFYISILDNTLNHGPGSQQHHNPHEADANFGDVVQGFEDVVPRIHSVPQKGWLDKDNKIEITKLTILVNKEDGSGEWLEWGDDDNNKDQYQVAQSK